MSIISVSELPNMDGSINDLCRHIIYAHIYTGYTPFYCEFKSFSVHIQLSKTHVELRVAGSIGYAVISLKLCAYSIT